MVVKKHLLFLLAIAAVILFAGHPGPVHAAAESGVESRIIRFIKELYPDGNSVRVKLNAVPAELKENAKVVNVSFIRVPDANGDGICSVDVRNPAGRTQSVHVPFRVYSKRGLFVLKQAGQKGDLIREKDIVIRETFMNGRLAGYPASTEDVIGKALKRDVAANTVITDQVLENQVVMRRGDIVTIVAESNKLVVSAKGKTVDQGRIGDKIRVKNIASGKEVTAKVISADAVRVDF
jgi:flagellar basal body P-ring formation protein FlgA